MKYIRTKEELGIEREDGVCCFRTWVAHADSPLKKDWLYANTIEELCDDFVVIFKEGDKLLTYGDLERAKDFFYGYTGLRRMKCIYGAIWTDKGLIYVAKMNDKGELELL